MPSNSSDSHLTLAAWLSDDDEAPPAIGAVRLPRVTLGSESGSQVDFVLGRSLGLGGMAEVRSARQVALARDVAVKRALSHEPAAIAGLVREAAIGAQLQHPNIVPVHLVGETLEGEPVVVMRQVSGETWSELAQNPQTDISGHLEVFNAVCRALSYAHAQGFVHRDVKPSNVLMGEFGEVYLLDWGVAVALDGRAHGPAGTPKYMAPEASSTGPVSVQLDVFGLACTLAAVLGGATPRRTPAGDLLPDERLPPGLRAVLERAGAADLERRTSDIETLRREVAFWVEEQEVEALLEAARSHEETLLEATTLPEIREQFAIARFAYGHVLERRATHEGAQQGLARCCDLVIRAELDAGHVDAADVLVEAHPKASQDLVSHLEETRLRIGRERAEDERLRAMARDGDVAPIRGVIARSFAMLICSLVISLAVNRALFGPPSPGEPVETAWRLVGVGLIPWATAVVMVRWHYGAMAPSPAGQRAAVAALGFASVLMLARLGTALAHIHAQDRPATLAYEPILMVAYALGQAPLSRRFLLAAGFGVLTWIGVVALFWSEWLVEVYNFSVFSTLAVMAWAWDGAQRVERQTAPRS